MMETITELLWTHGIPQDNGLYLVAFDNGKTRLVKVYEKYGEMTYALDHHEYGIEEQQDTRWYGPIPEAFSEAEKK